MSLLEVFLHPHRCWCEHCSCRVDEALTVIYHEVCISMLSERFVSSPALVGQDSCSGKHVLCYQPDKSIIVSSVVRTFHQEDFTSCSRNSTKDPLPHHSSFPIIFPFTKHGFVDLDDVCWSTNPSSISTVEEVFRHALSNDEYL